jgi:phospholipase/carboxylesterase
VLTYRDKDQLVPHNTSGIAAMPDPVHAHCFLPGTGTDSAPLVLLHGSGGNECELMPLASELAPKAAKLGIRGTVAIEDGYAFFHRFPDRRVDEADIETRTPVLAEFIEACSARCNFTRRPVVIGFSNGAIMAAALLLAHPGLLAGAILFRPLSPFSHDLPHRRDRTPVLIIDGEKDSRRSPGDGLRLAERLFRAGALATHHVLPVGHSITTEDKRIASGWLQAILRCVPIRLKQAARSARRVSLTDERG